METAKKAQKKIYGIPLTYYFIFVAFIVAGLYLKKLPDNMMVGFTMCIAFGTLFNYIGSHIPKFKDIGGGSILAVMGPSLLLYFGILPEETQKIATNFFSGYDFTSLLIPSLIVGSILAMKREILVKAGVRFFIPMISTLVLVIGFTGLVGAVSGYGLVEGMLFIAGPIMGAGMGMAAIPLSKVYAGMTGGSAEKYLSILAAAVMLANILTILAAAILAALGKRNPNMFFKGFSGEGRILRSEGEDLDQQAFTDQDEDNLTTTFKDLGIGFLLSGSLYALAEILGSYVTLVHPYLWMVIFCSLCKIFNLIPSEIEFSCGQWNHFITKVLTPAMLASIGFAMIDINQVLGILSDVRFLILCTLSVVFSLAIAGAVGYFTGFYFVESAIMAGLGLSDMGGTGDVAVLTASNRMHLLPFLQISSRIGGALDIFILTLLAKMLL